ncbi:MAG: aldo/keto reductase [Propioniciclava sp.]
MFTSPLSTITIPGIGTPLTRAVLGTMSFGDTADLAATTAVFEAAMAAGVTGVDCANGYASGTTEGLIAPLVTTYRDRIVLATKAGMPHPDAGANSPLSAAGLRASVEGSLRRLQVDSIDLFYLHQPDRGATLAETLTTIAELQEEQKIAALGISNYAAWQAVDIITAAQAAGATPPIIGQNVYNLLARRIEDEWVECAATHKIHTMCYNPLAGGLLATRPDPGGSTPTRFSTSSLAAMYQDRYWSPELLAAVNNLADIADEAGIGLPELGMRWVAGQPGTDALLLGGDQTAHLLSNLDSLGRGPLPDDVNTACTTATAPLKGAMPAYNR